MTLVPMMSVHSHQGVNIGSSFRLGLFVFGRRAARAFFAAALLLAGFGRAQEKTDRINLLIQQLQSSESEVRRSAVISLGIIGSEAKEAVPALIATLRDQDLQVRGSVPSTLGKIGPAAVPALIKTLKDQDAEVRSLVASALGKIGPGAWEAVPALVVALKDQEKIVRLHVAYALGSIGPKTKETMPELIAVLKDTSLKDQDEYVRKAAATALRWIGAKPEDAIPDLIAALKSQDIHNRRAAASSLSEMAESQFDTKTVEALPQLETAYEIIKDNPDPQIIEEAAAIKRTIDYFKSLWWIEARNRTIKAITDHTYISLAIAAYLLLQLTWLLFFWLRPLPLLKVIISLSKTGEKYKIPKIEIPIPLKTALVFPLFHYRPRLLDSWVRHHLAMSRENFAKKQTIAQRKVYVTMPALIDEQMRENISATTFQPIFEKKKVTVLIAGEGGAGKTSLACQMAMWAMADEPEQRLCKTHRMLPVLIEANLEPRSEVKDLLVNAVGGGLKELIGEPEPVFEELLLQLLRKRRVLVIVDSLSELDETTRKSVSPTEPNFPVAALVVTSRIDEALGGASKTILHPLRLKSDRLSTFMDRYLEQLGKRDLLDNDEDFFEACRRLPKIVGERDITVLIATMYIDQLIAFKEARVSDKAEVRELPSNLPDLMLGYVENLNDRVQADRREFRKVIRVTKAVGWECLKHTCRPTTAKRDDVLKALSSEADAEPLLKYLEERLKLIHTITISDTIRFSLDPLAEYLAALYLVERCGKFEDLWREFFENAKKQLGAPETIKGFLLAVRDCCVENNDHGVPEWVNNELARLAGLDPEVINTAQLKQRINRLITDLKLPDADDRRTAAEKLGLIRTAAREAVPSLTAALNDQDEGVRSSAASALGEIGVEAKEAVPALVATLNDQSIKVRGSVAHALAKFGLEAVPALFAAMKDQEEWVGREAAFPLVLIEQAISKEAVPALIAALNDQDSNVRRFAAEALRKIGSEAVPALTAALKHQDTNVRSYAAISLGDIGPEAKEAVPALITALQDQDADVRSSATSALNQIDPAAFQSS